MARRHIVLLVVVLIIGALAAYAITEAGARFACLDSVEQTVAGPGDLSVEVGEEVCDADMERLYLTSRSTSERVLILSYYRTAASPIDRREDVPPTVTWLATDHLLISIDVVDQVVWQRSSVRGVRVEYHIGRTVYR